jgi:hypothetical protein
MALSLVIAFTTMLAVPAETVVVLGTRERDLTGDGKPEVLRLVGRGKTIDSLDVTFTIESGGRILYESLMAPLTRVEGFDGGKRTLTAAEHRARIREFGGWFLGDEKFGSVASFVAEFGGPESEHFARIPEVMGRSQKAQHDTVRMRRIWDEIRASGVTVFQFSPGGDAIEALAWSARDRRFYGLIECC